jgi:dTMP kinase
MLIAFEGGDGTGKSTQARLLAARLGPGVVLTREPGGTAAGERIRDLLLDPATELDARAEALLMAAARAQHVAEVVAPALAAGRIVVTDRYRHSSLAYQSHGRGLPEEDVRLLSDFAGAPEPDVVVLLKVPAPERSDRLRQTGEEPDRFESVGDGFHRRVDEAFCTMAAADPDRWVVVDGTGSPEAVARRVWAAVRPRIGGGE